MPVFETASSTFKLSAGGGSMDGRRLFAVGPRIGERKWRKRIEKKEERKEKRLKGTKRRVKTGGARAKWNEREELGEEP